jgi:isopenicillin-N N-acyltransferase-like protein
MATKRFPFVEIRGAPRERGRQFGEACRGQIRRYPETLRRVLGGEASLRALKNGDTRQQLTTDTLHARAMTFLPAFEAFAPHLVEEIRGIAEGAGVPFAAALLVNVRAEVAGVREGACTAIGVAPPAGETVFVAQNQDQSPEMEELGVVLLVRPDDAPPALMATFGGLVGYPGVNGAGVAFVQNALANGVWRHALPHYPLKRALLEQPNANACLDVFDRAKVASCGNALIGDRSGHLLDVEATPDGYAVIEPEDNILVHTNHFQSPSYAPEERLLDSLPDSAARLDRMRVLLRTARGRITLDRVKSALRDHTGGPPSICRHEADRPMKTIASIIAEPEHGRLHVTRGNPCETEYTTYSL